MQKLMVGDRTLDPLLIGNDRSVTGGHQQDHRITRLDIRKAFTKDLPSTRNLCLNRQLFHSYQVFSDRGSLILEVTECAG
jgi:hypothetical protein